MAAKHYIYRNLHLKDTFSIRFRGVVIDRLVAFIAYDVRFKVNEAGRLRVLSEGHKNVHAFVVAERYEALIYPTKTVSLGLNRVSYNPYSGSTFKVNGDPIFIAPKVLFNQGQCFLL